MQASSRAALAVLRSLPEVGGIGTYSNGLLHADIRTHRFAWHGFRKARTRCAKGRRSIAATGPVPLHMADASAGTFPIVRVNRTELPPLHYRDP